MPLFIIKTYNVVYISLVFFTSNSFFYVRVCVCTMLARVFVYAYFLFTASSICFSFLQDGSPARRRRRGRRSRWWLCLSVGAVGTAVVVRRGRFCRRVGGGGGVSEFREAFFAGGFRRRRDCVSLPFSLSPRTAVGAFGFLRESAFFVADPDAFQRQSDRLYGELDVGFVESDGRRRASVFAENRTRRRDFLLLARRLLLGNFSQRIQTDGAFRAPGGL